MKPRLGFAILSIGLLVVTVAMVGRQRQQLGALRQQAQELQAHVTALINAPAAESAPAIASHPQHSPSLELLRLRGQVGQLERRKRELAGLPAENQKLQTELAAKATTGSAGAVPLLKGYIRRDAAKNVGFNSPEDSVQTLFWAIEHQDVPTFLQFFEPEEAKRTAAQLEQRGSEDFFKEAQFMPGFLILGRETKDDGSVELTVQFNPTDSEAEIYPRFKLFDGQWRMVGGF